MLLTKLAYGIGWPGGDLSDRFGQHFELSGSLSLLTAQNWYISANYDFQFGNEVKEDVISSLRTVEGGVIGIDRQFADLSLRHRGSRAYVQGGYHFDGARSDHRSGLLLAAGVGYLRHKVRIVDEFDSVAQLRPPADRGYDRLTGGWMLHQSIYYLHLSKQRMVNYHVGLELSQGFTKSLRAYNYSTQSADEGKRMDGSVTLKVGWILPFSLSSAQRYY